MFISVETQTERFFFEASGCKLEPAPPQQAGEPKPVKTRVLLILCDDGGVRNQYHLEPGDYVYLMNETGKTINRFMI